MSKKRHKKSRHRTPDRVDGKSAEKQRRVASEKKEEGTHEHHGSVSFPDRKRKVEKRDQTLPSPKTPSSGSSRELKKPVYRLSTSAEKKDSRKREEEISPKAGQHRRHDHRQGEKKHPETCYAATAVSTKDRKSVPSCSETGQSHLPSTSPQKSKANLRHRQDQRTVSGATASRSTATSPTKHASVDLHEQRRKLVKRRSEGENSEPPAKTSRSTPAPRRQSEELREERKKLVERRRSTEEVKQKTSSTKQDKGVQQDKTRINKTAMSSSSSNSAKLSRSARVDLGSTSQWAPGTPTSSTASHASPKPQSSVSFRISKKPSAPPPHGDIWDKDDESTDQSAASTPKFPSKPKAAQATSSFIPRSITKAGKATAASKSLSAAKAIQFSASVKALSSAAAGQATSYETLSTTKAVLASVSVKTTSSRSHCSTVEGQVTASPEPLYTPRAGPSTASLTPTATSKAIQNASSFGTFSRTGMDKTARSPELFSTPRTAHQAFNSTSPICWPQQQEKEKKVPQGFHSKAASFSTLVHSPEKTQVMPGSVLKNQPSFWSTQTVPASSFIFSEDNHDVGDNDQEMQLLEELQQARCEHLLEVNLVESYGELTAMDTDPPDEGATPTSMLSKEVMQQDLLIVLDTNILLSHLDLVKKIRSHGLGSLGFPTVLIPWVVLQELDAMKNGKLTSTVERRATPAVNYIYSCLKSQEPRLWGQSMQQASLALCGLKTENNDDRVLQCCLQYQKLYPKSGLILCTNDKNLCSKAVLSGVRALSKADLLQEVDRLKAGVLSTTPTADQHAACPSWQPTNKDEGRSREEPSPKVEGTERDKEEERRRAATTTSRALSESVCILDDTLKMVLSAILEQEMSEVYGDLWNEIVYLKPPWSLGQVLQCMKKHWIAVFGNIVQRGLQSYISQLNDYLCTNKTVDHKRVLKALSLAIELLTGFSSRSDYSGLLPQSLRTLQGLLQRLQPQPSRSPKADEDSAMLEEEPSQESGVTHQEVWQVLENTWTNVWNHSTAVFTAFRYIPGSMETSPPPSQDALYCLQKLCVAVPQLQQLFQRLLSADCSVNDAQSLLTFIQTTEIAAVEPRFTAQALYDCLSQQEYRQKLCVGSTQLSDVQANLERCAAAVERMWS